MAGMDGVLIIDKPVGLTSHDVVARVRRILQERRIGHTGTLDPFATGVLVILVGRATRLAQFLSGAEKEYEAVIRLGFATDTGDLTGTRLVAEQAGKTGGYSWSTAEIESALLTLRGEIDQVPPMYSAKKHQGQKLYELARRGEEIERQAVRVTISAFEALPVGDHLATNSDGSCDLTVRVVCSAGTYVRTLAEDFGKRLGIGAHLSALRRTHAGTFAITEGVTLDDLQEKVAAGALPSILISPDAALSQLPFVNLSADDARRVRNGMEVSVATAAWADEQQVRMRSETGQLMAIGVFDQASSRLRPRVVIDLEQ